MSPFQSPSLLAGNDLSRPRMGITYPDGGFDPDKSRTTQAQEEEEGNMDMRRGRTPLASGAGRQDEVRRQARARCVGVLGEIVRRRHSAANARSACVVVQCRKKGRGAASTWACCAGMPAREKTALGERKSQHGERIG